METTLQKYHDENGNSIAYSGEELAGVKVVFLGKNNTLVVSDITRIKKATISFDCNNATCSIGNSTFTGFVRLGEDCEVVIADKVTTAGHCYISTAEGSKVHIGEDSMIAKGVELRSDDAHAFFDVNTDNRLNPCQNITIGEHVWIGAFSSLLGGADVGQGSIIGYRSLLKNKISNNVLAVGHPARVIKKDIAWERPHLTQGPPFYKPEVLKKSKYWNRTKSGVVASRESLEPVEFIGFLSRLKASLTIMISGRTKFK